MRGELNIKKENWISHTHYWSIDWPVHYCCWHGGRLVTRKQKRDTLAYDKIVWILKKTTSISSINLTSSPPTITPVLFTLFQFLMQWLAFFNSPFKLLSLSQPPSTPPLLSASTISLSLSLTLSGEIVLLFVVLSLSLVPPLSGETRRESRSLLWPADRVYMGRPTPGSIWWDYNTLSSSLFFPPLRITLLSLLHHRGNPKFKWTTLCQVGWTWFF